MFLCRRPLLNRLYIFKPRFLLLNRDFNFPIPLLPQRRLISTPDISGSPASKDASTERWGPQNITLHEYVSFRATGGPKVSQPTLARLLTEALQAKDRMAVIYAANDLLRYPESPQRNSALRRLLFHTDHRMLIPNIVQKIIQALGWMNNLKRVSAFHLKTLTYRIAVEYARKPFGADFSSLLHSTIVSRMDTLRPVPTGAESVTQELPELVAAAFELLYYHLLLKNEKQVLELFQILTEKLYIPPEAVGQAPTTSTDFNYIASITLARSCLYWSKWDLAFRLILRYLPTAEELVSYIRQKDAASSEGFSFQSEFRQSLDSQLLDLTTDILYASLRNPNLTDLDLCVEVISRVHLMAPVQSSIIRLVYTTAAERRHGIVARKLYAFTRESAIETEHRYPGPQGQGLVFLMNFLTEQKGNTDLARKLAHEVMENDTYLPVYDRPDFLVNVVNQGFGTPARALWERYTTGKDGSIVAGNGALMLRMVRLFTRMGRLLEAKLPEQGDDVTSSSDAVPGDSPSGTEEAQGRELRETEFADLDEVVEASSGTVIEAKLSEQDNIDVAAVKDSRDKEKTLVRIQDFERFVRRVIESFVEAHRPLDQTKHSNLSTLARAYFVANDFEKGFRIFRVLVRRREVPDLHDINIGLSALAEHRPHTAAKMIEVMIHRGIQPDSVTFGTVIHQSMVHGDFKLVGDLLQRARQAGNTRLTRQGLLSLTRASVSLDDDSVSWSGKTRSAHLQDALDLLRAMPEEGRLSSPDMGKYLVYAAIREEETLLAFKFWQLLLKFSAQWDDREQVWIRKLLTQRILQSKLSHRMLTELGTRPSFLTKQ